MPVTLSDADVANLQSLLTASTTAHGAHDTALVAKGAADSAAATADAAEQAALSAETTADSAFADLFNSILNPAPPPPPAPDPTAGGGTGTVATDPTATTV